MLLRVFYISEVTGTCTATDLEVILGQARMNNRRLDITGMLAKSDGHFCQVLEGRGGAVDRVMARVGKDPRHAKVRILLEEHSETRLFKDWAMGLVMRDDMADELRQLHETGSAGEMTLQEVLRRLMESA